MGVPTGGVLGRRPANTSTPEKLDSQAVDWRASGKSYHMRKKNVTRRTNPLSLKNRVKRILRLLSPLFASSPSDLLNPSDSPA